MMTDNQPPQDHGIRTIEQFAEGLTQDFAIVAASNRESASRVVWFVAIAGFGFINMRAFGEAVLAHSLTKGQLILLSLPWGLTAVSGIVAHWLLGELIARDNDFHILRQHAIRAFLASAQPNPPIPMVLEILNVDETDEDVARRRHRVTRLFPYVAWAERVTFGLLLLSFVLSTVLVWVY